MRFGEVVWTDLSVQHLEASHQVTTDDVEEVLLGFDGEPPEYRVERDGDYYAVFGKTGGGRFLKIVGERLDGGRFRPFAARDMSVRELQRYRRG